MSIEPQQSEPPKSARRFTSEWHELRYVCDKIRYWWYIRKNEEVATRYQDRLQRLLKSVPARSIAIFGAEARALLCLLKGQKAREIKFRQREIDLIVRLHVSLRDSVKTGKLPQKTATEVLVDAGYDRAGLQKRRAMLASLKRDFRKRGR